MPIGDNDQALNTAFDDAAGPFGSPEGAWGDLKQLVEIPSRFHGVGRSPEDSSIRIVAGALGSGKSLLIRRMQAHQSQRRGPEVFAPAVQRSSDLRTEDVVSFTKKIGAPVSNSEMWKLLWRRGIMRSLASFIRMDLNEYVPMELQGLFVKYESLLGSVDRTERLVVHEVKQIIGASSTGNAYRKYLDDDRWADVENYLARVLDVSPPVFLYLDEIDKEFKSAPSVWTLCQKGLMHTILDLQREDHFQGRLHVVAAVRDTTMASVAASEHAQRLLDPTYVNLMSWDREASKYFLEQKVSRLPDAYFLDSNQRTVESFVGLSEITPAREGAQPESVADYLVRHTSMVPRDIIRMGNRICDQLSRLGRESLTEDSLRKIVSSQAAGFAFKLLSVTANQVVSDVMPADWWKRGAKNEPYALNWSRDQVLRCIESTASEVVGYEDLEAMDSLATDLFGVYDSGKHVHLADVLWQNRLLCAVYDDGHIQYFAPSDSSVSVSLPVVGGVTSYVWNPILFDVTTRLTLQLKQSHWPT